MASRGGPKSSKALFRDCLRLIKHMAGLSSPKAINLRAIVAAQFRANALVTDPAKLHVLKQGCVALRAGGGGARWTLRRCCAASNPLHALNHTHGRAERGLSNYLIYPSAKTDAKVAAHAADVGQYADDAEGNRYRR